MPQVLLFQPDIASSEADIDPTGVYRYDLRRWWHGDSRRVVNWIMLNPSTADASNDDPTIRRCMSYSRVLGFGGLVVTNLFAFRATDPKVMQQVGRREVIGPINDEYILRWSSQADFVIAAWGTKGSHLGRANEVLGMIAKSGTAIYSLRTTKEGHPSHPLYLPDGLIPSLLDARSMDR